MAFGNDRSRFVDNDFSGKRYSFLKNRFQINMITCVCENVPVQLNENVSEGEVSVGSIIKAGKYFCFLMYFQIHISKYTMPMTSTPNA